LHPLVHVVEYLLVHVFDGVLILFTQTEVFLEILVRFAIIFKIYMVGVHLLSLLYSF
jgi:hypothetical protein